MEPGALRHVVKVLPDVRWDLLPQVFQGLAFPNPLFQAVFNSTERTIFAWDLSCVDLPVLRIECDLADTRFLLPTTTGSDHASVLQKLYKGLGQSDEVDYIDNGRQNWECNVWTTLSAEGDDNVEQSNKTRV